MPLPHRRVVLLVAILLLAGPPVAPAQQPDAPRDSANAVPNTPLVDSLQAALDRFEAARSPTAADSARLRRWTDSVQRKGDSLKTRNPSEAREYVRQALGGYRALSDSTGLSRALRIIGITHAYQSEFDEALARYRMALQIARRSGDRSGVAKSLKNIGIVHDYQDRYDEALARYREALQIVRDLGDQKSVGRLLNNIGVVHWGQGRYEAAGARYREALQIMRDLGDREIIAGLLNNIGIVYEEQGQYEKALAKYQEALQIRRDLGDRRGIASTLNNLGGVYWGQGEHKDALAQYRKALQIERDLGDRRGIANALNNIGYAHWWQGRPEEALDSLRASLRVSRGIGYRSKTTEILKNIGATHLDASRLQAATDTLIQAVRLADDLRLSASSPEARRSLLSTQIAAYRTLTTAHVRAGRPDSALRTVEQTRARLLADRLAGTATGDTTFSIPSVTDLRRTLGPNEAALLYANAGTQWPLTALVVTRDRILAHELPDSTVRAAVEEAYPTQLNRLRREDGPLTAALGADRSQKQGTAPSLAEIVRLYRYYLIREQSDASIQKRLSRHLHDLLVAPIADAIADKDELVTVPTGALGYLPFETLRDSTGTHLIEEKHVRYAQSLAVLRQLQQRDYGKRKRSLLALGGAAYASDPSAESGTLVAEARGDSTRVATRGHASTLLQSAEQRLEQGKSPHPTYQQLGYRAWPDLPGTKTEVTRLGRDAGSKATVITGRNVAEDTVRAMSERGRLRQYRRLHFATHGIAVPETPALSALVLSQVGASDSLAARDGYLTMEEIAGLDLNADVAVLSACQTGLGRIIAGEGVVSLSHAFLRAGANATLVSQWKVLDESTRQFMTSVYKKAKAEDTSFAEAVSETKRAFIAGEHGEKNTDPLRWAPFVYYGRE